MNNRVELTEKVIESIINSTENMRPVEAQAYYIVTCLPIITDCLASIADSLEKIAGGEEGDK